MRSPFLPQFESLTASFRSIGLRTARLKTYSVLLGQKSLNSRGGSLAPVAK